MINDKEDMDRSLPDDIPINSSFQDYAYDQAEVADSTRTTASSTRDYRYEHGRRYHAYRDGSYPMPNDDLNEQHETKGHHMWNVLFQDRLFLPPIDEPRKVIDLGTGTGLWAMDMADRYPDASILGVDLTPPPPPIAPNLQFRVDDITAEWTPDEKFDLIHIRLLFGAIPDWPDLYSKIFENMESGGWLQQIEIEIKPLCDDGTLPDNSVLHQWMKMAQAFNEATGKEFTVTDQMRQNIEAAGFVDATELRFKLPLGPWSSDEHYRELGYWFEGFWRTGCQGWLLAASTRSLGWSAEQVNETVHRAAKMVDERKVHVYYNAVVVYAKKP